MASLACSPSVRRSVQRSVQAQGVTLDLTEHPPNGAEFPFCNTSLQLCVGSAALAQPPHCNTQTNAALMSSIIHFVQLGHSVNLDVSAMLRLQSSLQGTTH